jgi:hypothetical protein
MLRQLSSARFTRSRAARGALPLVVVLCCLVQTQAGAAADSTGDDIRLELSPRICTLAADDKQCDAWVHATWRSAHEESLCLIIVDRPEVRQCWENYSQGTYTIELVFSEDLTFQLKDPELRRVLASQALRVIREAISYRHRRRQPWNVFN